MLKGKDKEWKKILIIIILINKYKLFKIFSDFIP